MSTPGKPRYLSEQWGALSDYIHLYGEFMALSTPVQMSLVKARLVTWSGEPCLGQVGWSLPAKVRLVRAKYIWYGDYTEKYVRKGNGAFLKGWKTSLIEHKHHKQHDS